MQKLDTPIILDVPLTDYWVARIPGLADNVRRVARRMAPVFTRVRAWQAIRRDCLISDPPPNWFPRDCLKTEPSHEAFLRHWIRERGPAELTPKAFEYARQLGLLPDIPWGSEPKSESADNGKPHTPPPVDIGARKWSDIRLVIRHGDGITFHCGRRHKALSWEDAGIGKAEQLRRMLMLLAHYSGVADWDNIRGEKPPNVRVFVTRLNAKLRALFPHINDPGPFFNDDGITKTYLNAVSILPDD